MKLERALVYANLMVTEKTLEEPQKFTVRDLDIPA